MKLLLVDDVNEPIIVLGLLLRVLVPHFKKETLDVEVHSLQLLGLWI